MKPHKVFRFAWLIFSIVIASLTFWLIAGTTTSPYYEAALFIAVGTFIGLGIALSIALGKQDEAFDRVKTDMETVQEDLKRALALAEEKEAR